MLESLKKVYILFVEKDRMKFSILFVMMLIASLLEVLGIGMIPLFLSAIATPDEILQHPLIGGWLEWFGVDSANSLVFFGAFLLIAIFIGKNVYLAFYMYLKQKFVMNRGLTLQNKLFFSYMTAPYTFYINRNSAELLRNVTGEAGRVITGVMIPAMEIILQSTMFIFITLTLFIFYPVITLICMTFFGGAGYIFLKYTRNKTAEYGQANMDAVLGMHKAVIEGLGGFKEARVLKREKLFLDEFHVNATTSKSASVYRYVVGNLSRPIIETLMVVGILFITIFLVMDGRPFSSIMTILTLFGVASVRLMPIINILITKITEIRYSIYAVNAVFDDLTMVDKTFSDLKHEILSTDDRLPLNARIELKEVGYSYPNSDEPALSGISLSIPKGSAVAFVGPSGAGKTTLADIILGLLKPVEGSVVVDGVDIQENLGGWMKNIGYIPQKIYLLDDTIRRNITFGIPDNDIDEQKLQNAIEASQLEKLIGRLPKGERTVVGERGIRLSGGQQQRIGIARALYHNPQVLIMDEATSALDNITERFVIEAIERLRGDRTVIMIAHRLTTVKNCDRIFYLDDSRLIGADTYDGLLATNAEFRKLSMADG